MNFAPVIKLVLRQVHPEHSVKKDAIEHLTNMFNNYTNMYIRHYPHEEITSEQFLEFIRDTLPGELGTHATRQMNYAIGKLNTYDIENGPVVYKDIGYYMDKSTVLCNLRILYKRLRHEIGMTIHGLVAFGMVLEYLISEIMELSGNRVIRDGRRRITIEDINNVVENDTELNEVNWWY